MRVEFFSSPLFAQDSGVLEDSESRLERMPLP